MDRESLATLQQPSSDLSTSAATRILMIAADTAEVDTLTRLLHNAGNGVALDQARTVEEAVRVLHAIPYEVIVLNCAPEQNHELETLEHIISIASDLPVVLLTTEANEEMASAAIKRGATDYLVKSKLTPELLKASIRYAVYWKEQQRLRRQAEHRFEQAFRISPDAVTVSTLADGRFVDVNERFVELTGYPREMAIGKTSAELKLWPDRSQRDEVIAAVRRHGNIRDVEVSIQTRSGELRTVLFSAERIDWDGQPCAIAVSHDVTQQKRIEHSLRESEEKLRLILNSTAEAIYGQDVNGNCTFCNPASLKLLGYSRPDQLLGRNMHQLIHHSRPDGTPCPEDECRIRRAVQGRCSCHVEDEVLWRADGTSFPAEYWSYPILKDWDVVGSVVTFLNISERTKTQEALRQSEEKYREMVEEASYGIFRVTLDGRLLDVNPAFVAMMGYDSAEELLGINMVDVYANPEERNSRICRFNSTGEIDPTDVIWVRKDRKYITVRMSGKPRYDDAGKLKHFEVIVEDVTERRSLEKQLREAQKMEAVGRLAGGIAHDFNNLLMVINGSAEMMTLECRDQKVRGLAEQIVSAGSKASVLIRQLLAFSRKQVLTSRVLNLNALITDLSRMLPRLIGEDVELKLVLGGDLGAVKADPAQLEHVLMNLVVNARDAMPRGGRLIIQTGNLTKTGACPGVQPEIPDGDYVIFSVSDTGIGMDSETRSRIFEPFFTTKESGKGTGLGLSTVYGIVKQSDGFITVDTEFMHGTTFTIYLPRIEARQPVFDAAQSAMAITRGSGTVLLVEDEAELRRVTGQLLECFGYTVLETANGTEALELAKARVEGIDVILTDLVMPGMHGLEVVSRVRKLKPDVKVIYMSGYSDRMREVQAFGPDAQFLQKPFSAATLSNTMRTALGVAMNQGTANA